MKHKKKFIKSAKARVTGTIPYCQAKFSIPENCSAYVPMILKEFCSSKINGLVMKNFFRGSTFPGNMHNYIWCPYYLPSFMKFCSVVSEELC